MNNQHIIQKKQTAAALIGPSRMWKVLKCAITFCFALTLLIGCGGEPNLDNPKVREKILAEAIEIRKLQFRTTPSGEKIIYAPNQEKPYTGWVKAMGVGGEFDHPMLISAERGIPNGPYISWYSNGQNKEKGTVKNNERVGVWTKWYKNGQKESEGTYKYGNQEGEKGFLDDEHQLKDGKWVFWYENGQKASEGSYKDGKPDGLWIQWHRNGKETERKTYKDGKIVP